MEICVDNHLQTKKKLDYSYKRNNYIVVVTINKSHSERNARLLIQ